MLSNFLDEYFEALFWKHSNNSNLVMKVEPGVILIGILYNSEFLSEDSKLAFKIIKKCRMIFEDKHQTSTTWKSFANIIKTFSKYAMQGSNEFISVYISTLELFFEAIEKKSIDSDAQNNLQEAIDELDEHLKLAKIFKKANPSFKYFFNTYATKEKNCLYKDSPPLRVTNLEQCAKYFLANAILPENGGYWQLYISLLEKGMEKYRTEIKKIEPTLVALCVETTKKQFSDFFAKDNEKTTLSGIVGTMYSTKAMSLNDFTKCIDYIMDGIVNEFGPTNVVCFEILVIPNMEWLEMEASENLVERIREFINVIKRREKSLSDFIEVRLKLTSKLKI